MGHESQDFVSDVACQRVPALRTWQLRRSTPNMFNTRMDIGNHGLDLVGRFVSERQHDGIDSAVGGQSPHRYFSSLGPLVLASSLDLGWARRTYQLHQL